jgi:hypothetical protein
LAIWLLHSSFARMAVMSRIGFKVFDVSASTLPCRQCVGLGRTIHTANKVGLANELASTSELRDGNYTSSGCMVSLHLDILQTELDLSFDREKLDPRNFHTMGHQKRKVFKWWVTGFALWRTVKAAVI